MGHWQEERYHTYRSVCDSLYSVHVQPHDKTWSCTCATGPGQARVTQLREAERRLQDVHMQMLMCVRTSPQACVLYILRAAIIEGLSEAGQKLLVQKLVGLLQRPNCPVPTAVVALEGTNSTHSCTHTSVTPATAAVLWRARTCVAYCANCLQRACGHDI